MAASPHLTRLRSLTEELHTKDQELANAKNTLDSFFNAALDMLCIATPDGYFIKLNPAWEHSLGWTTEELQAKPFIEFVHPDDVQKTNETFQKVSCDNVCITYFRNRYRCKDGSYKILCWTGVTNNDDKTIHAIARDFTAMMEKVSK